MTTDEQQTKPAPKPSVGRVVHYLSRGSSDGAYAPTPRAAIVTDVIESAGPMIVSLCVLNPEGMYFLPACEYGGDEPRPGTWTWPPRV